MRHGALLFVVLPCALLISTAPASAQVSSCTGQPNGTPCDTDGNPCTAVGTCFLAACLNQNPLPDGFPCDDGVFCNGTDTCQAFVCSQHAGDPCPGPDGDADCSEVCNEAAHACTAADPDGSSCNDGNECTTGDSCFSGTCSLLLNVPNGTPCTTDGLFCSGVEACQNGACVSPGNPCPGPDDDGDCSESCDEAADNCAAADPNGSGCDDGHECTFGDSCSSGTCSVALNVPDGTPCTTDGLFCTGVEACQAGSCVSPGDPCGGSPGGGGACGESCDEAGDVCNLGIEWGLTVTAARSSVVPGDVDLSWSADCLAAADYAVYEGVLGDFTSHVPAGTPTCTTGGATMTTLTPDLEDSYYLVVPLDPSAGIEGSYGFASDWTPRVPSVSPCEPATVCDCSAAPFKTVFVTSTTHNGNLGGLAGADAECQNLADAAGLGGTFKAWLSDSTTSAASRLNHSSLSYVRTDGQLVADNWDDLTDNPTSDPLYAGIETDENGNTVPPTKEAWTGTTFAGNILPGGLQCSSWTDGTNASSGRTGNSQRTDLGWTSIANRSCNSLARLYCFEQ